MEVWYYISIVIKTDWSLIKSNDLNYSMELFFNYFFKLYDKSCIKIKHLKNNHIKSQLPLVYNKY